MPLITLQGACDGEGQCEDSNPCSEEKKTQIAACAADCTACTSENIDVLLGGCTVDDVEEA
eukprot:SAG31_NODE_21611_length_545_cov_1.040359_1_plen_60_part_10